MANQTVTKPTKSGESVRVLLSSYSFGLNNGAEGILGFRTAEGLRSLVQLTVVTGSDDIHEARALWPEVEFIRIPPAQWPIRLRIPGSYFIRYALFQRTAARILLPRAQEFDVVHHVSWGSFTGATRLWQLEKPLVFGPAGGGQVTQWRHLRYLPAQGVIAEILRNLATRAVPWMPRIRRMRRHLPQHVMFADNHETAELMRKCKFEDIRLLPSSGFFLDHDKTVLAPNSPCLDVVRLSVLCRLHYRKAVNIAVRCLTYLPPNFTLDVVGDGTQRDAIHKLVRKLNLDTRVTLHGQLPHEQAQSVLSASDLFLFTSVRDSLGATVIEAVAKGIPVVSLKHQGVAAFLDEESVLFVGPDSKNLPLEFAKVIQAAASKAEILGTMAASAVSALSPYTWESRSHTYASTYQELVRTRR